jgi:hypothetical protein
MRHLLLALLLLAALQGQRGLHHQLPAGGLDAHRLHLGHQRYRCVKVACCRCTQIVSHHSEAILDPIAAHMLHQEDSMPMLFILGHQSSCSVQVALLQEAWML